MYVVGAAEIENAATVDRAAKHARFDDYVNTLSKSVLANRRLRGKGVIRDDEVMAFTDVVRDWKAFHENGDGNPKEAKEIAQRLKALDTRFRERGLKLISDPSGHERLALKLGLVSGDDNKQGFNVWHAITPDIWSQPRIEALVNQTTSELGMLARDVSAEMKAHGNERVSEGELKSFTDFYNEWEKFAKAYKDGSWFMRASGGTVSQVQDYRARIRDWRTRLEGLGMATSAPTPRAPSAPFGLQLPEMSNTAKVAAIAGGAALLVLLLKR